MAGETSIAVAAAIHLATALPELRFHAGIAPHYLADDVVTCPVRPVAGVLTAPEGPGLGVELCDEAVERLRVRQL
jgi:L-alanine-DL-glutamate epimerase-like enolase superfamily enzyme